MKLTLFTDYALRVLLWLGAHPDRLGSVSGISTAYGISKNHLMKVVHELGRKGLVETVRGRSGGVRLARPASQIRIGEVVRCTEEPGALVDCEDCAVADICRMPGVFGKAMSAFLDALDSYTLADMLEGREVALQRALDAPQVVTALVAGEAA